MKCGCKKHKRKHHSKKRKGHSKRRGKGLSGSDLLLAGIGAVALGLV